MSQTLNAFRTHIELAAGELLFGEGDDGAFAYVVEAGELEVFVIRDDGERRLALRGPNEIVGEMALIDQRPRSASVRALAPSRLVVVTAEQVRRRLEQVDPLTRLCLDVLLKRFREMVSGPQLEASAAASAPSSALSALALENEIRRGIEDKEFVLFYQPIVDLASGELAGFEGLMRWLAPGRDAPIAPGAFIPCAEASGLITDLTAVALDEAKLFYPLLRAASALRFGSAPFLAINVSCADLIDDAFGARIAEVASALGPAAAGLKIEVTESGLMHDPDKAKAALEACRKLSVGVAIDDFGTGYSSLGYLATLPITTLKIDRSFIQSMPTSATNRKIVQTILRLSAELEIPVVAEGVETQAEADTLKSMGCRYAQGYLFGRPADLEATLRLIQDWVPGESPADVAERKTEHLARAAGVSS